MMMPHHRQGQHHLPQPLRPLHTILKMMGRHLISYMLPWQIHRAKKQVHAISRTWIADGFLEGQVRLWTKYTLWKEVKFITNDKTMNKIMKKAAKHFKGMDDDQDHWMSTYAHIVKDGLNQKRNNCSQDLRKMLMSKYYQP
jgi:hypothetical protein